MATTKKWKRVAAAQDGFLTVNASKKAADLYSTRKKRVNKNKKKSWNKHSDVQDVEQFLDDFRLQERAVGGLLSEKTDDSLFFVDLGNQEKTPQKERQPPPVTGKRRKGKVSRPLRIDLILKNNSLVPPSKDVLSHQQPNAKKLRRTAERIENQAAKGKVSQRQKRLLNIRPVTLTTKKAVTETGKNPERGFFDLWGGEIATETEDQGDQWYLQQTCKKRISRPERMNEKPSILPAVEVIAPGGSYNPDFFDHQALLKEAHEVEVKKEKVLTRLKKQLAVDRASKATEEDRFQEQVEGLVVDDEEEEEAEDEESPPVGAVSQAEKKTEKQRKKEKTLKFKAQRRKMAQQVAGRRQQLFQLRSLKASVKQREQRTKERRAQRKANEEAALSQPRRLGRQKFHPQDMEVQLSDELAGSLRRLKPEGSVLKDRFKSLQKRNLIEPRERAKFVRKHKVKYQEKRAFREIT